MIRFVTFGETLVQYNAAYTGPFTAHGEHQKYAAGAESNVAVNLAKLGVPGVETTWISRLGDDEEGEFILRELGGKTRVAARKCKGERTGVFYLNHLADGQPARLYRRKGSAASRLSFHDIAPHLVNCDVLHITGITPALSETCHNTVCEALRYAGEGGIPVSFDVNYREQLWNPRRARAVFEGMLDYATVFKVGHDEAESVWGERLDAEEYARFFHRARDCIVVVTRGPHGAVVYDGTNLISEEGCQVRVVDPVGAGDAFVAGFLGGIFAHCGLRELCALDVPSRAELLRSALEIANVCGALTCTRRGDTAAMPGMAEVRTFIESP